MSYKQRYGRRPMEVASRSQHTHIIHDASVKDFLESCSLPPRGSDVLIPKNLLFEYQPVSVNPVKHVFAVDGGYTEVAVQEAFPSSRIAFFQFGALRFKVEDLLKLGTSLFIDPDDMAKLKQIQRMPFTLPVRNLRMKSEKTFTASVRRALFDFFCTEPDGDHLIETLRWLIFREYEAKDGYWELSSCPVCAHRKVMLQRRDIKGEASFECPHCHGEILLTDVFRLHEVVDDDLGAGGVLGYLTNTVEQMVIAHLIRLVLKLKPALIKEILFVRDGPLAFFGQTANMHVAMRQLVHYLFEKHDLFLVGLEKSGSFVEHADEIRNMLDPGSVLLMDDDYIYKYVLPGRETVDKAYGSTTYYSKKLILKSHSGAMYVASLPLGEKPTPGSSQPPRNLETILTNLELLRCDMYDNALVPVALANKLVSLSNHPSSKILADFARDTVSGNGRN